MSMHDNWKIIVLKRFAGEYPPHSKDADIVIYKSSEDIAFDLSGMGEFSSDEVSAFLAVNGYSIDFNEDGKPVWKLTESESQNLIEE